MPWAGHNPALRGTLCEQFDSATVCVRARISVLPPPRPPGTVGPGFDRVTRAPMRISNLAVSPFVWRALPARIRPRGAGV